MCFEILCVTLNCSVLSQPFARHLCSLVMFTSVITLFMCVCVAAFVFLSLCFCMFFRYICVRVCMFMCVLLFSKMFFRNFHVCFIRVFHPCSFMYYFFCNSLALALEYGCTSISMHALMCLFMCLFSRQIRLICIALMTSACLLITQRAPQITHASSCSALIHNGRNGQSTKTNKEITFE